MRQRPRGDSRGILDPAELLRRVRFRRHLPTEALRPYVEHYWLIDWDLTEPFAQRVVPHPAVNVVFRRDGDGPETAEVAGIGLELFSVTLAGTGRVSGVQFRPGGFRPFWRRSVAELTGRRWPLAAPADRWPPPPTPTADEVAAASAGKVAPTSTGRVAPASTGEVAAASGGAGPWAAGCCDGTDAERCRALDRLLTSWAPEPDPVTDEVIGLVEAIRNDRSVLRVDDFAHRHGLSVRRLQRLFLTHVGVGPKWVIRRYRLQEAIEQAAGDPPDWATLAADLGYSDQAHLVREFSAVAGVSPAAYARSLV
ncbi:AraC family transcriptional regulator [Micromonospora phytophila]|uniref:helix-turn-helix domain-containing protein n=1 Tax=Micromonospora phytophila TaxID=709888 RepID=UPI00202E3C86|nr:AraC family transcriptional regulator [Micromonospora phytophila]MCM0676968.1 AraC family transcriptional regulator [Micromonospora phytophila]